MTGMSFRTVVFGLLLSALTVTALPARECTPLLQGSSVESPDSLAASPRILTAEDVQNSAAVAPRDTLSADAAQPAASASSSVPGRKRSVFRRIIDYFGESTQDRTFEKKIDFTFAGGPSYSKNTSLGIGLLAAGLYRLDRTDSITVPSDVSLFANISISGFFAVGISGNTIFSGNKQRIDYTLMFSSAPSYTWGIGYDDVQRDTKREYTEQNYQIQARYLRQIFPHTYLGGLLSFDYAKASRYDASTPLFEGQKSSYLSTGIGLTLEYDTRDFIPNPFQGVYVSFQNIFYPKALASVEKTLHRITFTADYYQRLWKDCVLALDLYGEFNSQGTPWPMLARLGGNQRMRGYYKGQYTDNDMVTLQMELRQRVWRRIGCVVWGGAGNVFPSPGRFDWSKTLPNYGLGLRWELKKRVNVRVDYGFGKKTSGFLLSVNEAF